MLTDAVVGVDLEVFLSSHVAHGGGVPQRLVRGVRGGEQTGTVSI